MNKTEIIKLDRLPANVEELKSMPQAQFATPFDTAVLAVAVMCNYEKDVQSTIDMINYLKGPQPLSTYDIQFIRDRLAGKGYVPRSYIRGTSPDNDYALPAAPYEIEVSDNPYSYTNEGYATLWLTASGADSPRQVTLRRKGDGQWLLWQITFLSDVRQPKSSDPWA